jgi:hypothetical protein
VQWDRWSPEAADHHAELQAEKEQHARAAAASLQQHTALQQQLDEARSSKSQALARCLQEADQQKCQLQVGPQHLAAASSSHITLPLCNSSTGTHTIHVEPNVLPH